MVGHEARQRLDPLARHAGSVLIMGAVAGAVVAVVVAAPPDRLSSLTVILGVAAVIAGLMVAGAKDGLSVSAGFIVVALAAVFLGARSAVAAGVLIEATSALQLRTRLRPVFQINLPAAVLPAIAGALVSRAISDTPSNVPTFYV